MERISAVISCTSLAGNASGAGLPAAREIIPGSEVNFNISRMTEGFNPSILSEKEKFIKIHPPVFSFVIFFRYTI